MAEKQGFHVLPSPTQDECAIVGASAGRGKEFGITRMTPAARKLAHEHIYWDQASVLAQLGLIDAATLPVCGADTARKALDPSLPANALIRSAALLIF
jgi:hypothetical protein